MTTNHAAESPLLRLESISKAYPGVVANDHIDLELRPGQVHALVGENGAGKSTLLSILYGLQTPDTGSIVIGNRSVSFESPRDAIAAGIGLVQQHFSMIPTLTLVENVSLAMRATGRRVPRNTAAERLADLGEHLKMRVPIDVPVGELPIATQQRAEVLKSLAHEVVILALDEPNALLTPDEWQHLAEVLRALAHEDVAILLVSHKLGDVLDVAEHVTVLREGQVVASRDTAGLDEGDIGELMVGARSSANEGGLPRAPSVAELAPRLRVEGLSVADDRGVTAVKDVDLDLRPGEIVGLAGVEGSGQIELTEALMGLRPVNAGRILHSDRDITNANVRERQQAGIAYIPSDRHDTGMIPTMSVADNLVLPQIRSTPFSRAGFLARKEVTRRAQVLTEDYDVRTPSVTVPLGMLSGGNQQKVILARELSREPKTIIACYPTRGLDFSATQFVRSRIAEQRDDGAAVLFASVDLDELIAWTDRIVVLQGGRVVGELPSDEADTRRLGLLMGGSEVSA